MVALGIGGQMLEWISTTGGPLVLMPKRLLVAWRGAPDDPLADDHSSNGKSDYDRACKVSSEVGVIPVGDGEALVLSGEVLETTWLAQPDGRGGDLVRWVFGEDDEAVERYLRSVPRSVSWTEGPKFAVTSVNLLLFDSVFAGESILMPSLGVSVPVGVYQVGTARYAPDTQTELVLHRLMLI